MAEAAAVDTSPLLYLSRAGLLDLLRLAGDVIAVPTAVAEEVRTWHAADDAVRALETHSWLRIIPAETVPVTVAAWELGAGESSVLAWGLRHPAGELVLDDLAARRCAASLGLPVRGTLGLVLSARQRGAIPCARAAMVRLREAGMYLSDRTMDSALRRVGE